MDKNKKGKFQAWLLLPLIGNGARLSEVYPMMTFYGPLCTIRNTNCGIRRRWFEENIGLIPAICPPSGSLINGSICIHFICWLR